MVKLKRMFLDGRSADEIREAEARAQQQSDLRMKRQDAVLHHDFDNMRREVETLGQPLDCTCPAFCPHPSGKAHECWHLEELMVRACKGQNYIPDYAGASMLGKKQKKDYDRSMLHQVKAKPMKGPRIPASLGQSERSACFAALCLLDCIRASTADSVLLLLLVKALTCRLAWL